MKLWRLGPFAILIAGGLWLVAHWDELPARMPVHWNWRGEADGFVHRTPAGAALPLILGAAICAMLVLMELGIRRSAASPMQEPTRQILLAGEYFVSLLCCGLLAASVTEGRLLRPVLIAAFAGVVALVAVTARIARRAPRPEIRNPSAWHGIFYVDRNDPALFVPKRYGIGYTLNFGRPAAVIFVVATLVVPVALAVFLVFSAR